MDHDSPLADGAEAAVVRNLQPLSTYYRAAYAAAETALRSEANACSEHGTSPTREVQSILLARLADDLRAIHLLCRFGLRLQAIALAASLLETVLTLGRIGDSDADAVLWRDWKTVKHVPWKTWEMIEPTVERIARPESAKLKRAFENWYAVFCMAKHNNGRLLTRGNRRVSPAAMVIGSLKDVSGGEFSALAIIMREALQISFYGLLAYCRSQEERLTTNGRDAFAEWRSHLYAIFDDSDPREPRAT